MIDLYCYDHPGTGMRNHAYYLARALMPLETVRCIEWGDILKHQAQGLHLETDVHIGIGSIDELPKLDGNLVIPFCTWETTRPPPDIMAFLRASAQVWTPSRWNRDVFIDNGLPAAHVRVVPEGVDAEFFHPFPDNTQPSDKPFTFLFVGKMEQRKSPLQLIEAFNAAFLPDDDVQLILHTEAFPRDRALLTQCTAAIDASGLRIRASSGFDDRAMVQLYNYADALVLPTRAEAWGMPISEAMACARPVIVTRYSGHLDFVTDATAYLIDVDGMDPVVDEANYNRAANLGEWARPSVSHLADLMRYVFEHQDEAREVGRAARQCVVDRWTWENAASIAMAELKALRG